MLTTNDKVKCVALQPGSEEYLTVGKIYPLITVGIGHPDTFTIQNDEGETTFGIYPSCAHGNWEKV